MINGVLRLTTALVGTALLAACGGADGEGDRTADAEISNPAADSAMAAMPGMGAMPGMAGMGDEMTMEMAGHMEMMAPMRGEALVGMVPQHRQMVANMISRMNQQMRDMNMTADAEWTAAIEALREDLVRLPDMTAAELEAFMPDHRRRVEALMERHGGMMGNMRM